MINFREFSSLEELNNFIEEEQVTPITITKETRSVIMSHPTDNLQFLSTNKQFFQMFYNKLKV